MKPNVATLALFLAFALLFSSQYGCSKGEQDSANAGNANAALPNGSPSAPVDASVYPPLPSGLAETEFELIDGTKFKVTDKKGKVLLLNLWGTWCGPCRAEMPTLIALQDRYRDKGFEIIGLNVGDGSGTPETNDQINKFVEQMRLNYTIARISNAGQRQFSLISKADAVPQTLLVDREGRLRGVFVGSGPKIYAQLEDNIAKVIGD